MFLSIYKFHVKIEAAGSSETFVYTASLHGITSQKSAILIFIYLICQKKETRVDSYAP
jgi:hypothetical protein